MKKFLIILMVSMFLLSGCNSNKEIEIPELIEPVSTKMDTAVVSRGDIYTLTTYDAKVYPDVEEVSFSIDGEVKNVAVSLGQTVKKGDILISLDDTKISEQLEQTKKSFNEAKINNEFNNVQRELDIQIMALNIEKMIENNASEIDIAKSQADMAKFELTGKQTVESNEINIKKMQERIDELEEELKKTTIVAPCDGNVVYLQRLRIKDKVIADNPVVVITDDSKLHLQSDFIKKDIINSASRIYALINGKEFDIEYIPLEADEILKMNEGAKIESEYSFTPDSSIAPGDYASICIAGDLKENVLTIPKGSLYNDSKGYFVYLMLDDNLVRADIEVGIVTDIQVEVISGLEEGDVVYVQG